ncbi:hypothetical protein GCM10027592_41340 [Spirosoma flavus]
MIRSLQVILISLLVACSSIVQAQNKGFSPVRKGTAPAGTERRLALVVGNKDYVRPDARLTNPGNDADSMAAALETLGFTVIKKKNLDYRNLTASIDDFGRQLKGYDVGLFYYSGHGLQQNGENYLVPTDANMNSATEVDYHCVRFGRVFGTMEGSGSKVNLVLLDACRNNPFPKSTSRALASGLTIPRNPPGSFVAYSTREGNTADDNPSSRNGLFTAELLKHLREPGLGLRSMMDRTIAGVRKRSGGNQIPGRYDELEGDFVFVVPASAAVEQKPDASVAPVADKPVSKPMTKEPAKVTREAATGDINQLKADMMRYQRKKNVFLGVAAAALIAGGATYLIANGKYNSYTSEVIQRNATYTNQYATIYPGQAPPSGDLLTPLSKGSYMGSSLAIAGGAVVGSAIMWVVSNSAGRRYRSIRQQVGSLSAIKPMYDPAQQWGGLSLALTF